MVFYGQLIHIAILFLIVAATWIGPRYLGLLGLLAAHVICVLGWFGATYVSLVTGIWKNYDSGLVVFGLLIQAFLLNCLLLPIGIVAMLRWRQLSPMSQFYKAKRGKKSCASAVNAS